MLQMMCTFTENTYFEKQLQSCNGSIYVGLLQPQKMGTSTPSTVLLVFNQPVKVRIHSCQFP